MITDIRPFCGKTVIEEISVNFPMQLDRSGLPNVDDVIGAHADLLGSQLHSISEALFPPAASKALRRFTSGEAARLIGVSDSKLRKMTLAGEGPQPEITSNGRR